MTLSLYLFLPRVHPAVFILHAAGGASPIVSNNHIISPGYVYRNILLVQVHFPSFILHSILYIQLDVLLYTYKGCFFIYYI